MDDLDKDAYILNSLSKIRHKKYELYIVSRVLFVLNDPDIEFVCQQYVKTCNGYYFVDMYFPQFDLYLKINEPYHNEVKQRQRDLVRDLEILDAAKLTPYEMSVYDPETANLLPLSLINNKIFDFCMLIKKQKLRAISEQTFSPWIMNGARYDPERYLSKGVINVDDNVIVRKQHHALYLFGARYKGWQSGWWKQNDEYAVWFPRFYKRKNSPWDNRLSNDGSIIYEQRYDGNKISDKSNFHFKRIVFAHYRNTFGQTVYKFTGVFLPCIEQSNDYIHVHKLVSQSYPVKSKVV